MRLSEEDQIEQALKYCHIEYASNLYYHLHTDEGIWYVGSIMLIISKLPVP